MLGANLFFASTGAVLDTVDDHLDDAMIEAWRGRVLRAAAQLRWPTPQTVARRHAAGISLALSAPLDQLFVATEVNEWALCATLAQRDPARRVALESALLAQAAESLLEPVLDESTAMARLEQLSAKESNPRLLTLVQVAVARELPYAIDDTELTLGAGAGGRRFLLASLPSAADVRWDDLLDIPTVLVTGSNGKTTSVRLLAACARAHGWRAGYNCTDGVFLDDEVLATGDYSGPAGARAVLRDPRTEAAILETARGGILRRGIAVSQADVALVTNVSSDHFGEYGIDDLATLAEVKLVVAAAVKPTGLLVLNADDVRLRDAVAGIASRFGRAPQLGWFSTSGHDRLEQHRAQGNSTCGVRGGRLIAHHRGVVHDLGTVADMPLTLNSVAAYNVANIAGAALAALAIGIPSATIATVLAHFGRDPHDNPGRMMRYERRGVTALVDYAHNPEGLRAFLTVANQLRNGGRLALLLGHAGNRLDEDIEAVVTIAVQFQPDLIVVKENESQLRGREPGEVPRIIRTALRRLGFPDSQVEERSNEADAARCALQWARAGDVLALPVHSSRARAAVLQMLEVP